MASFVRIGCGAIVLTVGLSAATTARPAHHRSREVARQQLEQVEQDRAASLAAQKAAAARAQAAEAEQERLAGERVAAAARLRGAEMATLRAAQRMDALAARRRAAEARLRLRASDLAPLLPLMARLSNFPAETLLAVPESPEDAMRAVLVLGGIGHQLESDAEVLRREQAEVTRLSGAIAAEAPRLQAAEAEQAQQAAALDRQIAAAGANARAAQDAAADAERQAAADAAQADSLRDAIARLDADRRAAESRAARAARSRHPAEAILARKQMAALEIPAGPGLTEPHGQLTAPVAGTVLQSFGAATEAGPAEGISYRASPAARVVAPCAGKIVFAAPFRSYKLLLILDCGAGYDFVLAGLDRLDVQVGRRVQAGEPVGAMAGWDPHSPGDRPTLYLELRRNGQPVNPAPWLKAKA